MVFAGHLLKWFVTLNVVATLGLVAAFTEVRLYWIDAGGKQRVALATQRMCKLYNDPDECDILGKKPELVFQ